MSIRPPVPLAPHSRATAFGGAEKQEPSYGSPVDPDHPVIKPGDPTVLVNGKPVDPQDGGKKPTSDATREAAAAKVAEQKLSGQAQEAKVRSQFEDLKKQGQTVIVNGKSPFRQDDQQGDCDGQNTIQEKK